MEMIGLLTGCSRVDQGKGCLDTCSEEERQLKEGKAGAVPANGQIRT